MIKSAIKYIFPRLPFFVRNLAIEISKLRSTESIFTEIYVKNAWGDSSSKSGPGSNLVQTGSIREEIPQLLQEFSIRSMLDIPCGDFFWMKEVDLDLEKYIGGDIVKRLVEENTERYSKEKINFMHMNIIESELPQVDLVLCRDLLVHFTESDIFNTLNNLRKSKSTYLLTTTFTNLEENINIKTGDWRPINLCKAPFNFPKPLKIIDEQLSIGNNVHKVLALWRLSDI